MKDQAEKLRALARKSRPARRSPEALPEDGARVIAVTSGKGGVGCRFPVLGDQPGALVQTLRFADLERAGDPSVDGASARLELGIVGDVARQRVFEAVHDLRIEGLLEQELESLQPRGGTRQLLLVNLENLAQQRLWHLASDHRGRERPGVTRYEREIDPDVADLALVGLEDLAYEAMSMLTRRALEIGELEDGHRGVRIATHGHVRRERG